MKPKPLIRATQLEKFRRFIDDVSAYDTEQNVIDTICGKFAGNELTRIGRAFHSIIETGKPSHTDPTEGCTVDVDGRVIRFNAKQLQIALTYRNEHPGAYHEIRSYKDYGRAVVTGCADLIDGVELRDAKTKFGLTKDSEYIDSAQWRLYLDIFRSDVFHFDLFAFKDYKIDKHGYDLRMVELERFTPPITCYRYPNMEQDNISLVNAFMDWAESCGIVEYLNFTIADF